MAALLKFFFSLVIMVIFHWAFPNRYVWPLLTLARHFFYLIYTRYIYIVISTRIIQNILFSSRIELRWTF